MPLICKFRYWSSHLSSIIIDSNKESTGHFVILLNYFVWVGLTEIRQACDTDIQTLQLRYNQKSNYSWCYRHLQILTVLAGPQQPFQSLPSPFILSTLLWPNSSYRQTILLQNVTSGMRGKAHYCLSVSASHAVRDRGKWIDSWLSADLIK